MPVVFEGTVGRSSDFIPEKLMCGILAGRDADLPQVRGELCSRFGPVDYERGPLPFDYTHYYDEEMGVPITRYFCSFRDLVSPDTLAGIKVFTNELEEKHAENGMRRVNLDPGCISLRRLMLASTKDNGRRIPLSGGIYAEITLVFIGGSFRPVPWTYPDFRSAEYLEAMKEIREIYKAQLKHRR